VPEIRVIGSSAFWNAELEEITNEEDAVLVADPDDKDADGSQDGDQVSVLDDNEAFAQEEPQVCAEGCGFGKSSDQLVYSRKTQAPQKLPQKSSLQWTWYASLGCMCTRHLSVWRSSSVSEP
jgi:hypothetical protein